MLVLFSMMAEDNLPVIRVTNISEDTTERDLGDLFRPFGSVTRLRLAKDKPTQRSRGFAFVTFTNRDDAQRAIDALQGAQCVTLLVLENSRHAMYRQLLSF